MDYPFFVDDIHRRLHWDVLENICEIEFREIPSRCPPRTNTGAAFAHQPDHGNTEFNDSDDLEFNASPPADSMDLISGMKEDAQGQHDCKGPHKSSSHRDSVSYFQRCTNHSIDTRQFPCIYHQRDSAFRSYGLR